MFVCLFSVGLKNLFEEENQNPLMGWVGDPGYWQCQRETVWDKSSDSPLEGTYHLNKSECTYKFLVLDHLSPSAGPRLSSAASAVCSTGAQPFTYGGYQRFLGYILLQRMKEKYVRCMVTSPPYAD